MQNADAVGPLLKIKDMAERFGVTRRTIANWVSAGTCPVAPVPGMKPAKWRTTEVEAFIAARSDN